MELLKKGHCGHPAFTGSPGVGADSVVPKIMVPRFSDLLFTLLIKPWVLIQGSGEKKSRDIDSLKHSFLTGGDFDP